ncbi:MAG TPA: NAD(P)/FAD-dependent oxidoreductase [Pseudonocardia sp.]|jgi:cyclohexanone monooxygenase|nr:NAD(P)/FAD-dependent oxidoreductase [Pseudonocardia sp.]
MTRAKESQEFDAVIIGAGFSGLYMLHRLRQLGMSVRVYESGSDVGGTWYWNRYPGARSDSDSIVYCFSDRFDAQLLREWEWSERYPSQPELLRYLQWVADRLDLRRDIRFNTKITEAAYDEHTNRWTVRAQNGEQVSAKVFIPAMGILSEPMIPGFAGMESFRGELCHTARMPAQGIDFAGKRVAVIGNGATAVQIVPEVAKDAEHLWEFQRNPYHCIPGRNHRLDPDDWTEIHDRHGEIWERARNNFGGFPYTDFLGLGRDFTAEQRRALMEQGWRKGGFQLAFATFSDVVTDAEINREVLDFVREKISGLIHDPELAELVSPDVPFATKRLPIEHGYYSALNRDNVTVVDIKKAPIQEITPTGIRTSEGDYDVDVILLATGFDAYTGAFKNLDIRGVGGQLLAQQWADGPRSHLGIAVSGFPNMFMIYCGPYNPAILTNAPALIEQQGEWIVACLQDMAARGYDYIDARPDAEDEYLRRHRKFADDTLIPQTDSWWTGTNVTGKGRTLLSWCAGFPEYQKLCEAETGDYAGFVLRAPTAAAAR